MPYSLNVCFVACLGLLLSISHAKIVTATPANTPSYNLAISFNLPENRVIGTAQIIIPANETVSFSLAQLTITGAFTQTEEGVEHILKLQGTHVTFKGLPQKRTFYVSYIREIKNERNNLIGPRGISLIANWYPYPSTPYIYSLSANVPDDFSAITQSDSFPLPQQAGITTSHWSIPTKTISFIAGPYVINKRKVRNNFYVYSMFFEEDEELAPEYLDAAANYLRKFETEIATFPYNHYVIVANRLPSGYGMPTFTLLGQVVLRLPFIKSSSLGHEIVHSWFGNDIEVDYEGGNWCEGLTSFLADHAFRDAEGKGQEDRKESLIKYHSYVHANETNPFSLQDFRSADHNQPMADVKRAVGYNGGAFLFQELQEYLGKKTFTQGIQAFYRQNRGRSVSWKKLQTSFEQVSNTDLETFFTTRLTMQEPPEISAENISISSRAGIHLNFTLRQQAEELIPMLVPIHVITMSGTHIFVEKLTSQAQPVSLILPDRPLELTLDPEYTLLRKLANAEKVPVWSQFLGADKKLIILENEGARIKYQSILKSLRKYKSTIVLAAAVTNQQLAENNLLFLGAEQTPCRSIFGKVVHNPGSLTVDVRNNPLQPEQIAVIISDNLTRPNPSIARRLSHYGKYSYVEFTATGRVLKRIDSSINGIHYLLESLPRGGASKDLSDFDQIVDELLSKRVIYIGETHTSLPDHLLQLRLIEALYQRDPRLAIGMEMFPTSSQASLDAYTGYDSTMDEKTFLKNSDYFNVWRYDYRLFRDILNFAKDKHIPVLGLNLNRTIVSEVYRSGNTDGLSDEVTTTLPPDRNLSLPGYQKRLYSVHNAHVRGQHGSGAPSGFIQAQGLWDETMATNIVAFLHNHPNQRMVVIAGSQHTRKDSGIPPRVTARMPIEQASLINLLGNSLPDNLSKICDFFFIAAPSSLPETAKIGIVLSPTTDPSTMTGLLIEQLSPYGKAAESGLMQGDILIRLDATQITEMADLRISMIDALEGDIVEVEVLRGEAKKTNHVFKVELTVPKMPVGHP